MSTEIVRRAEFAPFADADLSGVQTLAKALFDSGFFSDVKSIGEAGVKILAGAELGLGPVESMRSFHVIEGKIEFAAEYLAQRVRLHPHYDYRVTALENDRCLITFLLDGESLGVSSFTSEDRERAGLKLETAKGVPTTWAKFPRNMYFARAMSNGVAFFCPDVVAGVPPVMELAPILEPTRIEVGKARKATRAQLSKLVLMAHDFGWDDDERHRRAGVASFTDLTKQEASVLIEAWSASEPAPTAVPEEMMTGGDSEPQDDAATTHAEESEVSPPASGPPPLDPDAPPSEEFKRNVRRQLGRKNEMAPESSILILVRKFFDVKRLEDVTNGQLGIAFDAVLKRGSCTHPMGSREDGGFCRRCGQQVGAA